MTFPLVLSIGPSTPLGRVAGSILAQIDASMTIRGIGSPVGAVVPNQSGVYYWDSVNEEMWLCLSTDGSTVNGTTWQQLVFSFSSATTTSQGLVTLATLADVLAGTDNSSAVTSQGIATYYARKGSNGDITSLSGLTTPLSATQGGTQINSPGNAGNLLISTGTGYQSAPLYGAGADGGQLSANTVLTFGGATRFVVINSPVISLPTPSTTNNGFKMSFKNLGTGYITFNVVGGGTIDGATTFTDSGFTTQGYPCTDFEVRNGAWIIV